MALIAESKGFNAADSDTTDCVSLTSSVWGSEAPKTHLVFGVGDGLNGVYNHIRNSFGWSDGTNNVAIGVSCKNGITSSESNRTHQDSYNVHPLNEDSEGNAYERAVQSSYSNDPRVCHVWSSTSTDAYNYFLWALGGSDITDISIDEVTTPTDDGSGNSQDESYTGPGFQPDFLIVMHTVVGNPPATGGGAIASIGISDGTTDASVMTGSTNNMSTSMITNSRMTTNFIDYYHIANSGENQSASVKSLDSSGYTLTWHKPMVSPTRTYTIIAIKGPQAKVVASKQPTSNTTNDVSTATYSTGTTTVKPNADGTGAVANFSLYLDGSLSAGTGSAGNRYSAINNGVASPDDDDYVKCVAYQSTHTSSSPNTALYGFEDMPTDFGTVTSVTLKIRDRCGTSDPQSCGTYLQMFESDGTTPLTEKLTKTNPAGDISTSFADKTYTFTGLPGATNKTAWDGALLKISVYEMDSEDAEYFVSEVELQINYITTTSTDSGFVPKAGLCIGAMKTSSTLPSVHNRFTLGTWDAQDNMDAGGWMDENGVGTTDVDRYISNAHSIKNYNHAQGVVGQAAVAAEGNGIRETWTSTDGTQYAHAWLLLGDAASEGGGGGGGGESSSIVPVTNALLRPSLVGV